MTHRSEVGEHPDPGLLERFMRNEAEPAERRRVVRHLIAGCSRCIEVTGTLWALADPPAEAPEVSVANPDDDLDNRVQPRARRPRGQPRQALRPLRFLQTRVPSPTGGGRDLRERLADAGRRIALEREQAPGLAAELLSCPPAARSAWLAS